MTLTAEERAIVQAAESAIGKRPLARHEKAALFAVWRGVHGGSHDCAGHLASLEREARQKRDRERADSARLSAEREAGTAAERKRAAASRAVAGAAAGALREHLGDVLAERFPREFGPAASQFDRHQIPIVYTAVEQAPDARTRDYAPCLIATAGQFVTEFGSTLNEQVPAVRVVIEARAVDPALLDALLLKRLRGSGLSATEVPSVVLTAIERAAIPGVVSVRPYRVGGLSDLRDHRSTSDQSGSYTMKVVSGFASRVLTLTAVLAADPGAEPVKPAAPVPVQNAAWRGENSRDWVGAGS